MSDVLQDRLAAVARRMTRVNVCRRALIVLCISAGVLAAVTLAVGRSPVAGTAVGAVAVVLIVVSIPGLRRGPVDAARRVEQKEEWQEKLSTAYELKQQGEENVFGDRLSEEAKRLAERIDPAREVPLRLLRPAVASASACVVLLALWVALPGGMRGVVRHREDAGSRNRAEAILRQSADRLERFAPTSATSRELRMRLVGLMDELRRPVDLRTLRDRAEELSGLANASTSGAALDEAVEAKAKALERSPLLKPLADTLRLKNPDAFRREAERLAQKLPSTDASDREAAASAFSSAAESSGGAGLSDPLKNAAAATRELDPTALASALRRFEQDLRRRIDEAQRDRRLADDYRATLERVRTVLAGGKDPGPAETTVESGLTVDRSAPTDDNATSGNLLVHGASPELETVAGRSASASGTLPDVNAIRKEVESATSNPRLDPRTQRYVKRYFGTDNDTE